MNFDTIESSIKRESNKLPGGLTQIATNLTSVDFGNYLVYYSYRTPVAFRVCGYKMVVSRNYWSNTTGRHLSLIDGGSNEEKKARVSEDEFQRLWDEQMKHAYAGTCEIPPIASYTVRNLTL